MADGIKISGLPQATGITDSDVVAGVQNSATKKFPLTVILDWIRTRLTPASIGAQPTITASGMLKGDGSGGVSAAVAGTDYQVPLTIDSTPTQSSTNPVSSGGVYTALGSKADTKLGVYYAKCDTSAATQVKVISIPEITELYEGLSILVRFTYYQNYNGVPQLQINNLPAKDIRRNSTNDAARYEWRATEVVHLVYNGTYFQIVDGETASTTYYGYTKLSSSTSSTSTSLAATPSAVKEAYDLANGKQDAITASGILKGDGAGTVSAAVAGTDYATPAMIPSVPSASDASPQMDGTAAAGSSTDYSRADHVHPSDTSKANQTQLATVETGATASRAYAVGEYFCWGGVLYRAKTAIASGDSFTVGTNCETMVVTDGCYQPVPYSVINSNLSGVTGVVQRLGNIIMFCLQATTEVALTSSSELLRIPYNVTTAGARFLIFQGNTVSSGRVNAGTSGLSGVARLFSNGNIASGTSITISGMYYI